MGLAADGSDHGLGKLLVVAPDQVAARHYLAVIRRWIPVAMADEVAWSATSDLPRAHEILAAFRLQPDPSILVTVAMAYEGLDAPEVGVVAALTHIRSRPWLEQMMARATRVDPRAGPYAAQQALLFHPDDPLFAQFRRRMEFEQGTLARRPQARAKQNALPLWLLNVLPPSPNGITPLDSNALALRFDKLQPGPDLAMRHPEQEATQAVEDEAGHAGLKGSLAGPGLYHRYNAVLKRMTGNKSRAQMTLAEMAAAIGWLERNQLRDHLQVLDDDPQYAWTARHRGDWKPRTRHAWDITKLQHQSATL